VPPSKGQSFGGRRSGATGVFDEALGNSRGVVRAALADVVFRSSRPQLEKIFEARGALLESVIEQVGTLSAGDAPTLPAWQRYGGVVWTHLGARTLSASQRRRVFVPSALYGLVRSDDPVAPYRLAMSSSLGSVGPLAKFWRRDVTSALSSVVTKRSVVVDLLPGEHAASIDFAALAAECRVVRVSFVTADGRRAAGHDAKAVKGHLARRLLTEGEDVLDDASWLGWSTRRQGDQVEVRAPATRHAGWSELLGREVAS